MIASGVRWRITGALFGAQGLYAAAAVASLTVASIVGAKLSGEPALAGVPTMALYLGRGAAAYPIGLLMDRAGRRPGLTLGFLLGAAGAALAAVSVAAGSFALFLLAALFFGMGRASSDQSRYVAAEVHPAAERGRIIGLIVFAGTIGAISGPLLVSSTGDLAAGSGLDPLAGPWIAGAVLSLLSALVIFVLLRPDPLSLAGRVEPGSEPSTRRATPENSRRLAEILAIPAVRLAIASMLIGQVVMTMLMTITPLHMSHGGHDTQAISYAMMAHTFGMFGLSWATGRLVDRFGCHTIMVIGAAMLISAGLLAIVEQGVGLLFAVMFLLGLGWNFAFVAGSSLLILQLAVVERGRTQGVAELFTAAVAGFSGLGSGFVFAAGGYEMLGAAGTALAAALIAWVFWVAARPRAPAPA